MRSKVHIVKVLDKEFHDCRHGDKTFLIVPDMDYTLHGLLELQKVQDDGSFSGDYCRFIIVYKKETGGLTEGMCCLGIKKVE